MKKLAFIILLLITKTVGFSQVSLEEKKVVRACLNYLEGFYEGDTAKLEQSLQPNLYKFGFMKNRDDKDYRQVPNMTYEAALDFAKNVKEKKNFAKADAPKIVEVLDIANTIAATKVTAWWGIDYVLLSKKDTVWMIEQVLWEGPLQKNHITQEQ
tara:strand:+ start:40273 stop:40737 length:465 start_codon:yes stop_codon:yes gene_type:complete